MFLLHNNKDRLYSKVFRRFLEGALSYPCSTDEIIARQVPVEVLQRITPELIVEYFKRCAFEASDDTDLFQQGADVTVKLRANTLYYWKKCISHYMLMQNSGWDEVSVKGNPTKSQKVNQFIKDLVKVECHDRGVSSQARRPIEYKEFLQLLQLARKRGFGQDFGTNRRGQLKFARIACFLSLQWQLIARMDDMLHVKFTNLCPNSLFPFCLKCQIRWSKNTTEERSCPNQILMPSNEPILCPILNLGIYLEAYGSEAMGSEGFLFGGDPQRSTILRTFESLLSDDEFPKAAVKGKLGTHSIRKGACTYAVRAGLSRDYATRRGRWRAKKNVVEVYIDINQPFPDAVAASKLSGPKGACRYRLKTGVGGVSEEFVLSKVVPNCRKLLGDEAGAALGRAVLWAAFHEQHHADPECPLLQPWLRAAVIQAYEEAYGTASDVVHNPVEKVTVVPQGNGDELYLIEIGVNSAGEQIQVDGRRDSTIDDMTTLLSHQLQVQRQIEETRAEVLNQLFEVRHNTSKQFEIINKNLKRIALQPVLRPGAMVHRQRGLLEVRVDSGEEEEETIERMPAKLSQCPKTLFDLWQEYQFGLSGCKPAKEFNLLERGKTKSVFCRRKVFWDVIVKLVNAGHTSEVAIDKVYGCYGRTTSVTKILLKMVQDRKTGGHPNLRVGD